jgi:hypothetical protein
MRGVALLLGIAVCGGSLASMAARADDSELSAGKLDMLDKRGYFTPAFKKAVYDYIETREAIGQTQVETKKLTDSLPDLQKEAAAEKAKVEALRRQLALYTHPEIADFTALQNEMKNPGATPQDRLALAQAYVWTYPSDPHQVEAAQDMEQIEQQLAAQQQTVKQAAAARAAARSNLIQRAKAKELSLAEWREFLNDMSQEELLGYLGRPQTQTDDYWVYTDGWTTDPVTGARVGLQINFNASRVVTVSPVTP